MRRPMWLEQNQRGGEREEVRAGRRWEAGCTGPVGPGEDFEFYSRGVKFSPAERTNQAALPHKESVFGGLKNISHLFLETEQGRC